MRTTLRIAGLLAFLFSQAGCQYGTSQAPLSEGPYCSFNFSYSDAIMITGRATYNVRSSLTGSSCGLGAETLGGPIRRAEVQVLQGDKFVQCGHTDNDGNFSVAIPRNQEVVLRIASRASNAYFNASVLDTPTTNSYYMLSKIVSTYTTGNSVNVGTLSAPATGTMTGAAFNILDQILTANETIRYLACGTSVDTTCDAFAVAPKVTAYWKAGFNPATYFNGNPAQGLSFYVLGTRKLYILGGVNGNTDSADTDHFDNTIILHEYGHFIEDVLSKSNSPGGTHDGNHVLDARLVWSEGWANFFSSTMRANRKYIDTYGNISGTTGCFFNYDIEKNQTSSGASLDMPSTDGEGNFREFAIARALWDAVDPVKNTPNGTAEGTDGGADDDDSTDAVNNTGNNSFYKMWTTFTVSFASSSYYFRSMGMFLEIMNDANLADILTYQKMTATRADYAAPLPTTGAGCDINLDAVDSSCVLGGSLVCTAGQRHVCCSHQFKSNDFYYFYHTGEQSSISISQATSTVDLDLYLYRDGYTFASDTTDAVRVSNSTSINESISLSGVPPGPYLVNVSVKTSSNSNPPAATYRISVSGTEVCP